MKRLLTGIVIGALGLFAYQRVQNQPVSRPVEQPDLSTVEATGTSPRFRCDGRTHCSQMTSCEEATFFLQNCPGVKMDGEGDGVPCEKQWCGRQ